MRPFGAASVALACLPLLLLVVSPAPRADAAGAPQPFTVAGGPVGAVNLTPGSAQTVTFSIINGSQEPEHVVIQITGLHFQGDAPEFTGAPSPGLTVKADVSDLSLPPAQSHDVTLTLEAAVGVAPGGLYAGVVFKVLPTHATGQTTVVTAQARPLIGHVPGPTTDTGRITGFVPAEPRVSGPPVTFFLSFLDTGTIDYHVSGRVDLSGPSGSLGSATIPPSTVLPGNVRALPVSFSSNLPQGELTAIAQVVWGTSGEHSGMARTGVLVMAASSSISGGRPSGPGSGVIVVNRPPGHPIDWVLRLISLLLLLIILAFLFRRYLQRRAQARRLAQESRRS